MRLSPCVTMLCLAGAGVVDVRPLALEPQVFRSSADGISVNVSVRARNRPVSGLAAADFEVLDNGVPQTITAVAVESVPIDLTMVLDTSGSVAGAAFTQITRDVDQISALLGPDDRMRVITFANSVREVLPMERRGTRIPAVSPTGATAFFNAILASLMPRASPGRPHLIVVLSDGNDNVSLLEDGDVREVARRTDAVLHVLIRGVAQQGSRSVGWMPFNGPRDLDVLQDAAEDTGGGLRRAAVNRPAASLFKEALDEFKASYMLWYSPSGVPGKGWHDLAVRVKSRDYAVHARRGYFVD